jgi:hypothetical protein
MGGERKGEKCQTEKRCKSSCERCSKILTMITRGRERTMNYPNIYNFEANSDPANEELGGAFLDLDLEIWFNCCHAMLLLTPTQALIKDGLNKLYFQ